MIYCEDRPWGRFEKFHENRPCTIKLIYVNPNCRLSLQYHKQRSEFWKVIDGTAIVELDGKKFTLKKGEMVSIPKLARHRLSAGTESCIVMEISYGKFSEDDIVRIEDDYSRLAPQLGTLAGSALARAETA